MAQYMQGALSPDKGGFLEAAKMSNITSLFAPADLSLLAAAPAFASGTPGRPCSITSLVGPVNFLPLTTAHLHEERQDNVAATVQLVLPGIDALHALGGSHGVLTWGAKWHSSVR